MKDRRHEIGVGALMVGAAALLGWMSIQISGTSAFSDPVEVTAVFDDVTGLQEGAAVSVAGVEVGRVSALTVQGERAVVGLSIRSDAQIREDVEVRIRARSLLGEKYIALYPRGAESPLLKDGAVLTDTVEQVELTDLVTRFSPALESIDPAKLNRLIEALASAVEEDPERPGRMLSDAEATLSNLKEASEAAPEAVEEARAAIRELRATAERVEPVLSRADRVLTDLETAAAVAPGIAEKLPGMAEDAEATLEQARKIAELLGNDSARLETILHNLEELDKWELRRLLREEGILVRLRESEVVETDEAPAP